MNPTAVDTFKLLGPKPEVPPTWLASHGTLLGLSLVGLIAIISLIVVLRRRRHTAKTNPADTFRAQLTTARNATAGQRTLLAAAALRTYLASLSPDASVGLTTQELASAVVRSPVLVTAADPILRTLRSADQAKFAGATHDGAETLALAELAFATLELARQALWKEVAR